MSTDELQSLASNFRLAGIVVTFIGFTVTCISHVVAERLLVSQRADKLITQERLKASDARTVELERKLAHREFTPEQRAKFISFLSEVPKGPMNVVHVTLQNETMQFLGQITSLLKEAGFSLPPKAEYNLSYVLNDVQSPWYMALIIGSGEQRPFAAPMKQALLEMGVEVLVVVGDADISAPGEVKIYIGSK